jgi:hypothetical protein
MGLKSSTAQLQKNIEKAMRRLPNIMDYFDALLIHSKSQGPSSTSIH